MASGSFCLTHHFPGIEKVFERGVHLDWFENFDEMLDLVDKYLKDDEERKAIASLKGLYHVLPVLCHGEVKVCVIIPVAGKDNIEGVQVTSLCRLEQFHVATRMNVRYVLYSLNSAVGHVLLAGKKSMAHNFCDLVHPFLFFNLSDVEGVVDHKSSFRK